MVWSMNGERGGSGVVGVVLTVDTLQSHVESSWLLCWRVRERLERREPEEERQGLANRFRRGGDESWQL